MSATPTLLKVLGPPALHTGAQERAFLPELRYQLLALLAHGGQWVTRTQLAATFWPQADDAVARRNLRKLLFKLRHADGFAQLEEGPQALRWRVPTDVQAFDAALAAGRIDTAAALWRGEPWAGLDRGDESPFDAWLLQERGRLRQRWREAMLHAARQAATPQDAQRWSRRLLALDPTDEDAVRLGMQAHLDASDPAQAQRLFQAFEQRLRQELDLPPTAATRALLQAATPATAPPDAAAAAASAEPQAFVGRRAELRALERQLAQPGCRWLTVLGPGGSGKSRLVHHALAQLGPRLQRRTAWVPLDDLQFAPQIGPRLADSLGLRLAGPLPPLAQVQRALQGQPWLLALDNLEHLPGAAPTLHELLVAVPDLQVLATSREPAGIAGEVLLTIEGLPCPQADETDDAAAFDAVQLFLQRARCQQPQQDPMSDPAALCALCARLGGLPLALELAAVWTRHFSVAEILRDLQQGGEVLEDHGGRHPPRHRSMAQVFDHSWQQLVASERRVLARLSVFQGPFTRESARAVADAGMPVLAALIDKSLLHRHALPRRRPHAGSARSRFLLHLPGAGDARWQSAAGQRHPAGLRGPVVRRPW